MIFSTRNSEEQVIDMYERKYISLVLKFLKNYRKYTQQKSFYPEKEHKSRSTIAKEFILRILRHGEIETNYFAYGLDVKNTDPEDYMSYTEFMLLRDNFNGFNKNGSNSVNYACIVRDKNLFEIMCNEYSLPTIKTLGFYQNGLIVKNTREIDLKEYARNNDLFIKPVDSFKGLYTYSLVFRDGTYYFNDRPTEYEEITETLNSCRKKLIVQDKLSQHDEMNRIYGNSINTIRIVTILHKGEVEIVGMFLRLGGHGSIVDNMSAGGLGVGINPDGTLMQYGFLHNKYGTKTDRHPDTGVVFSTFKIPYFKETLELVKTAQMKFKEVPAIGWDVCITPNGPLLVEGNDNFGGIGLQTICGGKAKLFREYFNK